MAKNPYFIRLRVGGDVRLECSAPSSLTALQLDKRKRDLALLRNDLLSLGDNLKVRSLLELVCKAETTEQAALQSKLALRYVREQKALDARSPVLAVVPTFQEFASRWATNKLAEDPRYAAYKAKLTQSEENQRINLSRLAYINRTIGHIPITRLTLADCRRAVAIENLPKTSKSGTNLRQYYQVIQTVLRRAMSPCELITDKQYPLPVTGWLPPIDAPPSYAILYPRDAERLFGNHELPLWRRLLYGLSLTEAVRAAHLLRLRWRNINLADGLITIGAGKNNANARTWAMQHGTCEALRLFRPKDAKGDAFIFPRLSRDEMLKLADGIRADLAASGVTDEVRPDLFASGDGGEPFRFQDLRQSFVAWALAMGWTEAQVMARTQHTTSQVMQKHYGRKKELATTVLKKQGPFLPLDVALGLSKARPPEAWSPHGESLPPKAPRVGNRVGNEKLQRGKSSMITGTPGGNRTPDLRIRNPLTRISEQHEVQKHREKAPVRTRKNSIPHPEGGGWGILESAGISEKVTH